MAEAVEETSAAADAWVPLAVAEKPPAVSTEALADARLALTALAPLAVDIV